VRIVHLPVVLLLAVSVIDAYAEDVLVRLTNLTDCSVESVLSDGYDIASVNSMEGSVDIVVDRQYLHSLDGMAADMKILPESWLRLLPENADNAGYYYSPEENWAFWTNLAATYPNLVHSPVTIGKSYENRDIYSIRITSQSGLSKKPAIFFNSLIHAREPAANSVIIDFGRWLASEYGSDTMATYILDNAEIYLVPIVNPDGYAANMPSGGDRRKNMNFSVPVASDGIDLNRNFGYRWGFDDAGSSPDPYSDSYRGSAAFSEKETQVIRSFTNSINPIGSMHYHSYGGMVIYSWNYENQPTPHQSTFQSWAAAMTAQNNYTYGRCGELMYPANGDACDWSYDNSEHQTCLSYGAEVNDSGFWGSQNDSTAIAAFCAECRFMNRVLCMNLLTQTGIEDNNSEGLENLTITGLYPNPVEGSVYFSSEISSGAAYVTVFDLFGRKVDGFHVSSSGNEACRMSWEVPENMPNGVYSLVVESGGRMASTRFTVLR